MLQDVPGSMRAAAGLLVVAAGVAAAGCDKAQLLAPTRSTISLSAPTRVLPTGGSTEVSAFVVEEAGTPVQNGTAVRFTASLGRLDPPQVQTRNGIAITTFHAMNTSGVARITASSGGATGGDDDNNALEITIGAAAVKTVTLRANPGSVGPAGGSVELIATVVGENGRALEGIAVTFNTDQGTLSASTALTDAGGQARVTLTTTQKATVSATAGATTSSPATVVDLRAGPIVTIACAPASGTDNCAAVQAGSSNNTATVIFTVTKATGSSALRTATLDFGDGTSPQAVGNLAGGSAAVPHTYDGPSGSTAKVYTATVQTTDVNGDSGAASTAVTITPRAQLAVTLVAAPQTAVAGVGLPVKLTATVTPATGGADVVAKYEWEFGDGQNQTTSRNEFIHVYTEDNKIITASVKVTTTDGRTATDTTQFIVSF